MREGATFEVRAKRRRMPGGTLVPSLAAPLPAGALRRVSLSSSSSSDALERPLLSKERAELRVL